MPIIKTSDELRSLVPGLDKTLKFDSISSLINEVETDILTSVLGFELVDTLNTIYESGAAATPLQKSLLSLSQKAVAYLAVMKYLPFGAIHISDSGVYVISTGDRKPISDAKLHKISQQLSDSGFNFIEKTMEFLEANLDEFPEYKNSEARKETISFFITSAKEFTRFVNIRSSRITFMALLPVMGSVEETWLTKRIGADVKAALLERRNNNALTDADKKLLPKIKRAVAFMTTADAAQVLSVELRNDSILINEFTSSESTIRAYRPDPSVLEEFQATYTAKADEVMDEILELIKPASVTTDSSINSDSGFYLV